MWGGFWTFRSHIFSTRVPVPSSLEVLCWKISGAKEEAQTVRWGSHPQIMESASQKYLWPEPPWTNLMSMASELRVFFWKGPVVFFRMNIQCPEWIHQLVSFKLENGGEFSETDLCKSNINPSKKDAILNSKTHTSPNCHPLKADWKWNLVRFVSSTRFSFRRWKTAEYPCRPGFLNLSPNFCWLLSASLRFGTPEFLRIFQWRMESCWVWP